MKHNTSLATDEKTLDLSRVFSHLSLGYQFSIAPFQKEIPFRFRLIYLLRSVSNNEFCQLVYPESSVVLVVMAIGVKCHFRRRMSENVADGSDRRFQLYQQRSACVAKAMNGDAC